jgi:O-antigen ligase
MLQDRWLFGWGAGCFRYGFPLYAQKYPTIYKSENNNLRFWEHAHDDLLEFPIEFGVVGLIPLFIALGCAGWQLTRRRFWRNGVSLALVLVCTLVACHSWVDFVFQNPAVLLTWCVLLLAAVRWLELDQPGAHRLAARTLCPDSSPVAGIKKPAGSVEDRAGLAGFAGGPQSLSP